MNKPSELKSPSSGMVLAAGLGTRMQPITNKIPKPLVKVRGKTLLDHGLDSLESAGVSKVVVNVHHHPDLMQKHLEERSSGNITISDETDELLNSGGGIAKALPHLGNNPFYLLNADSFWVEGYKPNLERMAETWRGEDMDILMLVSSMTTAVGYDKDGDFNMESDGRLERRLEGTSAPFAYAGAAIVNPSIFQDAPKGAFNLNVLFDKAIEQGRLFGIRLDGLWLHVGTPEAIAIAEDAIEKSAA